MPPGRITRCDNAGSEYTASLGRLQEVAHNDMRLLYVKRYQVGALHDGL